MRRKQRKPHRERPWNRALELVELEAIRVMHREGFSDDDIAGAVRILPRTVRLVLNRAETWEHCV